MKLKHQSLLSGCTGKLAAEIVALCLLCCFGSSARTRSAHASFDREYVSALAAANRFLQAWQTHDQETAILLLTNTAKRRCSEKRLDAFFSSDSQVAYEIARGRKVEPGRYLFPVTIFGELGRTDRVSGHLRRTELIVTKTGNNDWAVDKLP